MRDLLLITGSDRVTLLSWLELQMPKQETIVLVLDDLRQSHIHTSGLENLLHPPRNRKCSGTDSATITLQTEHHSGAYRCILIPSDNFHFPRPLFLSVFKSPFPAPLVTFQVLLLPFPSHSGLSFPKLSCLICSPFSSITFCSKILQFHLPQES